MELKPGYRLTEVGVIPEDWECRQLLTEIREMTDFVAAGSFETLRNNVRVFDVPKFALYVRLVDLRLGLGHDAQKYVDESSYRFLAKSNLFGKEILVANIGANVGETFLMPNNLGAATIAPNMIIVRPNDQKVHYDFLYHYIASDFGQARMRELIAGSGHPKINKTDLKKLKVLVPPLPEQRAIAEALSDVDGLLSGLDRLIAKKRDLKQAAMQQLLTGQTRLPGFHGEWGVKLGSKQTEVGIIPEDWRAEPLGDYVRITSGESPSLFHFATSGLPYFKVEQLSNGAKFLDVFSTPYHYVEGKTVPRGSIIFAKRGGAIALNKVRILAHESFMDTNLMALTPTAELDGEYLYYALGYIGLWRFADTTSVPQINNKHIKPLVFPLPEIDEQRAIAAALSDMDAELAALEQRRQKTRALKQAMLQELLTGKTRLVAVGGAHA